MLKLLLAISCLLTISAFITPLKSRGSRCRNRDTSTLFASNAPESKSTTELATSNFDAYFSQYVSREDVTNLLSVCHETQNSQKYQPAEWANSCKLTDEQGDSPIVVATRDVKKGEVLTLFPIHAIGLLNKLDDMEHIEFSSEEDKLIYENNVLDATKVSVPVSLDESKFKPRDPACIAVGKKLFIRISIVSLPGKETTAGWLGGVIKNTPTEEFNSIILPLPYASPFCAVVATRDIGEGDEIIRAMDLTDWDLKDELEAIVATNQKRGITTLRNEVQKAFVGPFHPINLDYPGLKKIHSDPDIYEVDNFLTEDEMDRLISKAKPYLQKRWFFVDDMDRHIVPEDVSYEETVVPHREIPSILNRFANLANCSMHQFGHCAVLHYEEGMKQQIRPHVDDSRLSNSELLDTKSRKNDPNFGIWGVAFCYLNDVAEGGTTYFPDIDFEVKPRRGTALLHFPTDIHGRTDARTLHQGSPATAEKWLYAVTFWNFTDTIEHARQSRLDPCSADII